MTKPCSFNLLTHFEILCTQTADTVEDGPHESELSHGNDDITTMTVSAIYLQYTYIKFNGLKQINKITHRYEYLIYIYDYKEVRGPMVARYL